MDKQLSICASVARCLRWSLIKTNLPNQRNKTQYRLFQPTLIFSNYRGPWRRQMHLLFWRFLVLYLLYSRRYFKFQFFFSCHHIVIYPFKWSTLNIKEAADTHSDKNGEWPTFSLCSHRRQILHRINLLSLQHLWEDMSFQKKHWMVTLQEVFYPALAAVGLPCKYRVNVSIELLVDLKLYIF